MTETRDSAGVRFPPPFIYLIALLIGLGADQLVTMLCCFGIDKRLLIGAGTMLGTAGLAIGLMAMGLFRRAGTNPEPWEPTHAIVTTGIYGVTRNPMYIGMALIYAGIAIGFDAPIALLLLPIVIAIVRNEVIAREERYLTAKFGEAYTDYQRRVRRWL